MSNAIRDNLLIITRNSEEHGTELLIGEKKHGIYSGYDCFPGGPVVPEDGCIFTCQQSASRELAYATGIELDAKDLSIIGLIMVTDERKKSQRFGFIDVVSGFVHPDTEPTDTEDLNAKWVPLADAECYTKTMPPDVRHWFPGVLETIPPFHIHLNYADGTVGVRIIEDVLPYSIGNILRDRTFILADDATP